MEAILDQHKPGGRIPLLYRHRNTIKEKESVLQENSRIKITQVEGANQSGKAFKLAWLSSKINK
ncbi:MAG: hypothetical protein M3342_21515 [Bacteroidota bacterium]|nr:hypothetical protein [Flavisolibacter sp.]MDQ3846563.1 hypothetical protein [Bacteroidota bacterium]